MISHKGGRKEKKGEGSHLMYVKDNDRTKRGKVLRHNLYTTTPRAKEERIAEDHVTRCHVTREGSGGPTLKDRATEPQVL